MCILFLDRPGLLSVSQQERDEGPNMRTIYKEVGGVKGGSRYEMVQDSVLAIAESSSGPQKLPSPERVNLISGGRTLLPAWRRQLHTELHTQV